MPRLPYLGVRRRRPAAWTQVLCALALLILPAEAAAATVAPAGTVALLDCVTGAERSVTFEARMHALAGAPRLELRFTLQTRAASSDRWRTVAAEGFGIWLRAKPGVRRFTYAKRVDGLVAPASYRTIVRFRWRAASGRLTESARVTSARCGQPDQRPQLRPLALEVLPGGTTADRRYLSTVRNTGRGASGAFAVRVSVAGRELPGVESAGLAAGATAVLAVPGPYCRPGDSLLVTLDPLDAVDERDEDDNVLAVDCPR